ncbi:preprotein translocase subunit YajC [Streptococcus sciuri]|uniref:Preprotein translocase subunit YajC n=1 Tax=Streptococcus sciuri TaxID=2973939 RepID=A0ABT2F9G5_9STRE|nr:preprotein translocase subunit YajC [Streptococcus sciuri]MCS4488457.1 preprotein translocase subunit YajC [Streptococcus sciuri]
MPAILMIVLMVAMIWFMQRSQKKQAQQRQEQLSAIQPGDEVVTIGGLYGKVDEVDRDAQKMVLDIEGVYLTFEISAIKRVVAKNEAVREETSIETAETAISSDDEKLDKSVDTEN